MSGQLLSARDDVASLWLHTLQRMLGRASHDVKDAMNGVSVNLEVIRSRAARPDTPASAVLQFGEAAAQQFERLTILTEALLVVGRAEREPADVALTLKRIVTLCGASSSSADAAVRLDVGGAGAPTTTRIAGCAVRLALTAPLLDLVTGKERGSRATEVTCALGSDDDSVTVMLTAAGRRGVMPEHVAGVVRSAGVQWNDDGNDLRLIFPRS